MAAKVKVFKTVSEFIGGHWHTSVFSANSPDQTFAKIGTLVMDQDDMPNFADKFDACHVVKIDGREIEVDDRHGR